MAHHKDYTHDQMKIVQVSFRRQILSGRLEHSLSKMFDHELDLSTFDNHYFIFLSSFSTPPLA
jgi:hypothetical protein